MRIICRDFVPDGPGTVEMVPHTEDDLWKAYNLIAVKDTVTATTHRRVQAAGGNSGRVTLTMEIQVAKTEYDKKSSSLRVRGKSVAENEHVKIGKNHALEIELHRSFVLWKPVWDLTTLESLRHKTSSAVMVDEVKTDADDDHADLGKEFDQALSQFFKLLMSVPNTYRAIYGPKEVEAANEAMAVQTLLITDDILRNTDVVARQRYSDLLDSVKESGGSVCVLPGRHVSCKKLKELTGVAAILRFPMPHLEDIVRY